MRVAPPPVSVASTVTADGVSVNLYRGSTL